MADEKKDTKTYAMETPVTEEGLQLIPARSSRQPAASRSRRRKKGSSLIISEDLINRIVKKLKDL